MTAMDPRGPAARHLPSRPTTAERARTVLAGATGLGVGIAGVHHQVHRHVVDLDGSVLVLAPAGAAGEAFATMPGLPPVQATVTATDLADLPFADRVRGRLVLTGALGAAGGPVHPALLDHLRGPAATGPDGTPQEGGTAGLTSGERLLRFQPGRVRLQWRCEVPGHVGGAPGAAWQDVDVAAFRSARADALVGSAGTWLTHLDRDHAAGLAALAEAVRPGSGAAGRPRPLLVDRHGLVLRTAEGADVRLPFDAPATGVREAALALGRLAGVLAPRS